MLKIGTDCSGIEAPIEAMKKISCKHNINFKHMFSSEIDKFATKYIQANHNPEYLFDDIKNRNINDVPDIDIYVAGFPCQPYSRANKFKLEVDPRTDLFHDCAKVIHERQPKIFILENVKTLVTLRDGYYFDKILESLNKNNRYHIHYKIINSKDYGIPQCRERLYIIGISREHSKDIFKFPEKIKMKPITSFVDKKNKSIDEIKECNIELFNNIPKDSVFIDIGFRKAKFPKSNKWAPCITAQPNMWCVPMNRKASVDEYLKLQGFPLSVKRPISDHQMKKKIGNSMTVDVIELLLINCLKSINIIK
tara:strand:- start:696 stop:1619 length:924 start_codon:yes stop_codon:yes gene_type:complete